MNMAACCQLVNGGGMQERGESKVPNAEIGGVLHSNFILTHCTYSLYRAHVTLQFRFQLKFGKTSGEFQIS